MVWFSWHSPRVLTYLLAPQSGALRISAYRDFLPIPSHHISFHPSHLCVVREKNWSFKKKILPKNFMWRMLVIPVGAKQLGPLRSLWQPSWPRFVAEDWPLILRGGGGGGRAAPASPLRLLGPLPFLGRLLLPPVHVHLLQVSLHGTPHIPLPLSLWTGSWWGRLDQELVPELHPVPSDEAFGNALGKPVKKSLVNRSQQCCWYIA